MIFSVCKRPSLKIGHQLFNGIWAQKACRIAFLKHLKTESIVSRDKIQMAIQQIIAMAPVPKIVTYTPIQSFLQNISSKKWARLYDESWQVST